MPHRPFFWLLSLSLQVGACSKEPLAYPHEKLLIQQLTVRYTDHPYSAATNPVKSTLFQDRLFYVHDRYQDTYQYDIQRRITRITSRDPDRPTNTYSYYGNVTFDYQKNTLIVTNLGITDRDGQWMPSVFTLNEQGNIVEGCTYDSDGYLLHRQLGPTAWIDQTIQNGNIVKTVDQDATQRRTTIYAYDFGKAGLTTLGNLGAPVFQWGRSSQNLLVKTTEATEFLSASGVQRYSEVETTYSYGYDQTGLINQKRAHQRRKVYPDSPSPLVEEELLITDLQFN